MHGYYPCTIAFKWGKIFPWTYDVCCKFTFCCFVVMFLVICLGVLDVNGCKQGGLLFRLNEFKAESEKNPLFSWELQHSLNEKGHK